MASDSSYLDPESRRDAVEAAWPDEATARLAYHKLRFIVGVMHDTLKRPADRGLGQDGQRLEMAGLLEWAQAFLPAYFVLPPSPLHRWLAEQLDCMHAVRGTKLNVLGPRGGAKSTLATLAFVLRAALERREPYIWLLSDTKPQAYAHLDNLKAELVDNPRLLKAYPEAAGRSSQWRAGGIVLRNGVAIDAFGSGQRIRGRRRRENRPTLILCDDLENDDHIQSAARRDHSRRWFHGTLLKAGTPATNIVNLATALHREALALQLHQAPGWVSRIFPAIETWPQDLALWEQWEVIYADPDNPRAKDDARRFFDEHRAAMEAGAVVLWPEREDLYTLMAMRAESGRTAFEREKQNVPLLPESCEWPETYFPDGIWFEVWPHELQLKVLTLDPSKGADARRGDYSAFVCLGLDAKGVFYVEADLARRPVPQILADGVALHRRFQPAAFGIEANQFQELLAGEFDAEFRRQGLLAVQPWLIHNRTAKEVRIRRLGPFLAARRLRMKTNSPSTRLLVNQLREFPAADHDDGPDALEMAIQLVETLLSRNDDGLGHRLPVG